MPPTNPPKNWHEVAALLKQSQKPKKTGLLDRVAALEQKLKDKK